LGQEDLRIIDRGIFEELIRLAVLLYEQLKRELRGLEFWKFGQESHRDRGVQGRLSRQRNFTNQRFAPGRRFLCGPFLRLLEKRYQRGPTPNPTPTPPGPTPMPTLGPLS
jgi:hypothetical protein